MSPIAQRIRRGWNSLMRPTEPPHGNDIAPLRREIPALLWVVAAAALLQVLIAVLLP